MNDVYATERILNYIPEWDDRNMDYTVQPLLTMTRRRVLDWKYWGHGQVLDQGREGACVGFGWTAELMASPYRVRFNNPDTYAREVYRMAQKVDAWPGENYEGTSVLAGAKVVHERGLIGSYRWALNSQEIIDSVLNLGPVVVGIPWNENMYFTRPSGLVDIGGDMVGGHCLTITGYSPRRILWGEGWVSHEVFRWVNSWGPTYGKRGAGYIKVEDFDRLFSQYGEACVPVQRHAPSAAQ